jgi:hypothetical protein
MAHTHNPTNQPVIYHIRLAGHLDRHWRDWFGGLTITLEDNGETLLTGPVVDQAALHGLLKKVRDVGIPLISVVRVEPGQAAASAIRQEQEQEMNANEGTTSMFEDVKIPVKMKLSALWAVFMFLYVYDVLLALFEPGKIEELITGSIDGVAFTPTVLFASAIIITIPSVMVFLSLIVKPTVNRWANILLGIAYTGIGLANALSSPELGAYLIVFYSVEGVLSLLIAWYAWRWPTAEGRLQNAALDQGAVHQ